MAQSESCSKGHLVYTGLTMESGKPWESWGWGWLDSWCGRMRSRDRTWAELGGDFSSYWCPIGLQERSDVVADKGEEARHNWILYLSFGGNETIPWGGGRCTYMERSKDSAFTPALNETLPWVRFPIDNWGSRMIKIQACYQAFNRTWGRKTMKSYFLSGLKIWLWEL